VSAADLCLALALSALLSVVVAAAQYMRAEKAEAEVARLTAERDALAQIKRHIDEVRNGTGWTVQIYGVLLQQCDQYGKTIDTRRAERAEAERDALAATVARVEALAGQWERLAATAINPNSREWLQACAATLRECLSGWPKMSAALAGSEADTTDVDVCSGDADCTSELHVHGCFADTAGPCTDPDEHQPTEQECK
jgi:small-conductance mechanosensitive channel